jgi:glycosyltransferase involved in cell wall biosynthesis
MIIDAYTFCWNEEVRLPYFLRLWAPICRKVIIFDNGSTDNSYNIAKRYDNVVWDSDTYGQNQINDVLLRHTKNNCWKDSRDADLVFVGDIDEIVYHPTGLKYFFNEVIMNRKMTAIQPFGYEMVCEHLPTHDGLLHEHEDFQYGEIHEAAGRMDKLVTFSPKHLQEVNFDFGCHGCAPEGLVKIFRTNDYKLLHYKLLNREFYSRRTAECGMRMSQINKKYGWGKHYLNSVNQNYECFDAMMNRRTKVI